MNNTELKTAAENLHKVRVVRRGAGLEQFYNMWRTATRDPDFLRTGCYSTKGIIPIRARKDYGWAHGEFWVSVREKMEAI